MNASTLITLLTHQERVTSVTSDLELLKNMGLIIYENMAWRLTPRGEAHVKQLLNTPLPVQVWASADGEAIV